MTISSLHYVDDARVGTDPSTMLQPPNPIRPEWKTRPPWFDESGWVLPMGGYLVRTGSSVVLIDAGLGPDADTLLAETGLPMRPEHSGRLLASLAELGVTPEAVTDVVLTHLHADHVGWVASGGEPVFPNARHVCHRNDVERVRADNANSLAWLGVRAHVEVVADLLVPTKADRTQIADGVTLRLFAGHTPGNCIVDLDTTDGPVLLLGDTAHHPALLVEDGWTDHADDDHTCAARARGQLGAEMERTGAIAFGAHFPDGKGGRITRDSQGTRTWTEQSCNTCQSTTFEKVAISEDSSTR
jgi:glyoxylase-like metal-dependent hydrolase (beta-lactamase superfamily II)